MKKTISLKNNKDFENSYKSGNFACGKFIVIYANPNSQQTHRLGITVSKKVGNSVIRNRIKRLVRENYIQFEDEIKMFYDFVIVARKNAELPNYYEIKKEMKYCFRKLNLIDAPKVS